MKIIGFILLVIFVVSVVFICYGYWTNRQITTSYQTIQSDSPLANREAIKILHVSDIHFGRLRVPLKKLHLAVAKHKPDLILVTGDTIDRTEDATLSGTYAIINQFCELAPTFVIEGNHERTSGQFEEWRSAIHHQTQAVLLENETVLLSVKDNLIAIAGLKNEETSLPPNEMERFKKAPIRLLLAHHPELISDYLTNFENVEPLLIFSGHAHGGQIRLPLIGGLFAPDQGIFPKYTNGRYTFPSHPTSSLLVSRGLANSRFPFRINNKPQLIAVTIENKA